MNCALRLILAMMSAGEKTRLVANIYRIDARGLP